MYNREYPQIYVNLQTEKLRLISLKVYYRFNLLYLVL